MSRWRRNRSHQQHAPVADTKPSHFPIDIVQIVLDFLSTDLDKYSGLGYYGNSDSVRHDLLSLTLISRVWREPTQRELFKELSPTSYRAARLLVKVISRNPRLASYARTISAPDCSRRSTYDCNKIVDLFQRLWLCCPNVIAIAIPLHLRYITPATNIWDRGSGLTHLVLQPSAPKSWNREPGSQYATWFIELAALNRLTLYRWNSIVETDFLRRLILPKLKQVDFLYCSFDYREVECIWNSPTLERVSLICTFFHKTATFTAPTKVPRLSILTDHMSLNNDAGVIFDNVVALHIHSRIPTRDFFTTRHYLQLEVLYVTLNYICCTGDLISTIEQLAVFIKEKNRRAPRLVALHLTMRWSGRELLVRPLGMPTTQLLEIFAYCLYQRCLAYHVSLSTHVVSYDDTDYSIYGVMPDFPSHYQPWIHNHRSISRFVHIASHYRIPLWRGKELPSLASLWN